MYKLRQTSSLGLLLVFAVGGGVAGQYISSDTYTRYELLAPESHQFKIYYEVTETRVGARFHFNLESAAQRSNQVFARREITVAKECWIPF